MPEIIENVRHTIQKLLYGSEDKQRQNEPLYPLTERQSYLLKYTDAVSVEDALDITKSPGYSIMAPYFSLKLLDNQPAIQKQMLEAIIDTYSTDRGYEAANNAIEHVFKPNGAIDSSISLNPVSAKELSRVATWGPGVIDKRAHEAMVETRINGELPVIIGYGGLLALKAAIDTTEVGEDFLIVLPKKIKTDTPGYKISHVETGLEVQQLDKSQLEANAKVTLVDDATHTGDTFKTIGQLFPHATLKELPLFKI